MLSDRRTFNIYLCLIVVSLYSSTFAQHQKGDSLYRFNREGILLKPDRFVPLSMKTLDEFIELSSGANTREIETLMGEIERVRENTTIIPELFHHYHETTDFGKKLIILKIIGRMKQSRSIEELNSIISDKLPTSEQVKHGSLRRRDLMEMLQTKALESLAFLREPRSDSLVLETIRNHPSVAVRAGAINAYLFNHGDSLVVKERLREIVKPEDQPFIDRVRHMRSIDRRKFDRGLARFRERYPDTSVVDLPSPDIRRPQRNEGKLRIVLLLAELLLGVLVVQTVLGIFLFTRLFRPVKREKRENKDDRNKINEKMENNNIERKR